jgi:hypothetical protein
MRKNRYQKKGLFSLLTSLLVFSVSAGCVTTSGKVLDSHQKGMRSAFEDEYVIPKKPIDRHYIGSPWSKQFGPVEDPDVKEIRVKKERSLNNLQQDFAYQAGLKVGGMSVGGSTLGAGMQTDKLEQSQLEGVEIITAYSLADIPFKPKVAYITEALRLANFSIKKENSSAVAVKFLPSPVGGDADMESASRSSVDGEGLVVAYKLHSIDLDHYKREETGRLHLALANPLNLPNVGLLVNARLQLIEPGVGKSLPRSLLWACPRAEALNRNIVAAWIVDVKPTLPGKKSLSIGFPAYPEVEECKFYSGVLSSHIDPVTDKIVRQVIEVFIIDDQIDDSLNPQLFNASISIADESFKIKLVKMDDIR